MESLTSCQYQEGYLLEFFPLRSADLGSEGSLHLTDTLNRVEAGSEDIREDLSSTQCDCACDC